MICNTHLSGHQPHFSGFLPTMNWHNNRQNRISLPAKVTTTVVVILLVPNLATCQLYGASVAKEDLCFLHLPWETNTTRSVSADYHEIRARNYIPVPNTTFPILKKGFQGEEFRICLLRGDRPLLYTIGGILNHCFGPCTMHHTPLGACTKHHFQFCTNLFWSRHQKSGA